MDVLMPCRALEAFRRRGQQLTNNEDENGRLNALSGIGGVQTKFCAGLPALRLAAS